MIRDPATKSKHVFNVIKYLMSLFNVIIKPDLAHRALVIYHQHQKYGFNLVCAHGVYY